MYSILKSTFSTSSIHGLSGIFLSKTWLGRICWFSILFCATTQFYILLYHNINYFNNQPVTKSIDTTVYPISSVPFPAVTVCTTNYVYKTKSDEIENKLIKNGVKPEEAKLFLKSLSFLRNPMKIETNSFEEVMDVLTMLGYTTESLMEYLAQPCDTFLKNCSWDGVPVKCSELFAKSKGELGYCCSFNSELYSTKNKKQFFTTAGPFRGLYVKFNMSNDQHVSASYNTNFIIVYVHRRETFADDLSFITFVGPGKEVNMKMLPTVYDAEPLLQQVNVKARHCLLDVEGSRHLNQTYNFPNCMVLCKLEAIQNLCGCVPYYYPGSGTGKYCTLLDVPCLALYQTQSQFPSNKIVCDCLPSCSEVSYSGSIDTLAYPIRSEINLKQQAAIRIYFQNNWCKKYTTTRSLTGDSFIGLVGGLFALCLGGSILSIVEIFFKLIKLVVLFCIQKKYKPQLYWNELMKPVQNKT